MDVIYIVWAYLNDGGECAEKRFCGAFSDPRPAEELKDQILENVAYHKDQLPPITDEDGMYAENKDHWDYYLKYEKWFELKECEVQEFILDQPFNFETITPLMGSSNHKNNELRLPPVMPPVCPRCMSNKYTEVHGCNSYCSDCDLNWETEA